MNLLDPEKGQNIYLMEFTASKMDFCSRYCIHSPGKHLRNINIDPSELRENLAWNPVEGYIIRYSIYFLKCFQKLHGTEWICWTLKKGQNIYLMGFIGFRMNFPIPYCILSDKAPTQFNIDPSDPTQPFTKDSAQIQSYEKTYVSQINESFDMIPRPP